jgi:predicted acylesterase/phospholipase RssA
MDASLDDLQASLSRRGVPAGDLERVHLLLSAGGVRCLSYIGALEQLEKRYEIATVSTCSAGTLIGALYCCGVSPQAMREAVLGLDLRRLAGDPRRLWLRRLLMFRSWPYALYSEPGIPRVFQEILEREGLDPNPTLGGLRVPLCTAAVDVAAKRLLVYSTDGNADMAVTELLSIATAIPFLYPPHERQGRAILDASLASYAPIWLATGQVEDLPIVVLRPQQAGARVEKGRVAWMNQVMSGAIASRDTFLLERMPKVRVYDIRLEVSALNFALSRASIEALIETGRREVAEQDEAAQEQRQPEAISSTVPDGDDTRAQGKATALYGVHLDRLATRRAATVFLSYAREDRQWVKLLRQRLGDLLAEPGVSIWDDSYIKPGSDWDATVGDAIRRARVAVLFVSRSFVESAYINGTELPLLRAHVAPGRVLWVSVDGTPPAGPEQALQAVGNARALTSLDEPGREQLLSELARQIEETYRQAVETAKSE